MTLRAENRTRDKAVRTVREMQGHLRALTNSCRVPIDAHAKGIVSLASIGPFDWERFGSAVAQAEVLVRPETIDRTAELIERHRTVKLFAGHRSAEHTSELQSLMRISYAVFCLQKKKNT